MSVHEFSRLSGNRLGFPALAESALFHGVFNRHSGVSPAPWHSRNVAFGLGDEPHNVRENRKRIKKALDCTHLVSARQIHGASVHAITENPGQDIELDGFDSLITNVSGVGLMIQQADCQAVMLFDPVNRAVGIAHAGWRGTAANIIGRTVLAMQRAFTTEPADLVAAVSPSLGPCCAEFINYPAELPAPLHSYQIKPTFFDFWAISRDQLAGAGVQPQNIHTAALCTRCDTDYFSYRREGATGRFASVIGIRKA